MTTNSAAPSPNRTIECHGCGMELEPWEREDHACTAYRPCCPNVIYAEKAGVAIPQAHVTRRSPGTPDAFDIMDGLEGDELRVLKAVADRLRIGKERYGQLVMHGDLRDWRKEAREELLDYLVYRSIGELSETPTLPDPDPR